MVVKRIKNDELYHHGVKGQRWGVRHYQNTDGSLTSAGRQRYSEGKTKTIYTNRLKYTTGKSKGVKRRQAINDTYFKGGIDNFNVKYNKDMKPNTVRFTSKKAAAGVDVNFMSFKDENSLKAFSELWAQGDGASGKYDAALSVLAQKYGDLEYDINEYNPDFPFMMFTNIDEEDRIMPALALLKGSKIKKANVLAKNIGRNGMPSNISEIARKTGYQGAGPKDKKPKAAYLSNGAPSNVKKTIYLKKPRRTYISSNPGTNGIPTNLNGMNLTRKKK